MALLDARSRTQSLVVLGGALAALYLALFAIVGSSMFSRAPDRLAIAVTFDLTITATALVWWLGVRRAALPRWAMVVALSWGVAAARRFVPHAPLGSLVAVAGALELVTMGWLLVRIRRVVRAARAAAAEGPIGAVEAGLFAARIPARVAAILATEIAVVGLALTGWFRRPPSGALTMRSTGWLMILALLAHFVVGETIALHLLIGMWNQTAAWIATASSIYGLVWLAGEAHAVRLYPPAVVGDRLRLQIGIRWRAAIPLAEITQLQAIRSVPDGAVNLALMEPTVLIQLRAPIVIRGLLGRTRRGDRLALTIDDPAALARALGQPLSG